MSSRLIFMRNKILLLLITPLVLCAVWLTGCSAEPQEADLPKVSDQPPATEAPAETDAALPEYSAQEVSDLLAAYENCPEQMRDPAFLEWCNAQTGYDVLFRTMVRTLEETGYSEEMWFSLTGRTARVLQDLYHIDELPANVTVLNEKTGGAVDVAFFGDINMSEEEYAMQVASKLENGPIDCVAPALVRELNAADITMCNFECTFSIRGYPFISKHPNFRCHPSGVSFLEDLGVDIVTLANNHIYDYTTNALLDTLTTLDGANIRHVGAGKDDVQAQNAEYFIVNGVKIAFVSASRAEIYIRTPAAKENRAGIFEAYDPEIFLGVIEKVKKNADYVVAVIHAGNETSTALEKEQVNLAHLCAEHGADLVVGSHPQNAQGFEYYKGTPIAYSVGNFWYGEDNTECLILHAEFDTRGISLRVTPCVQENAMTRNVAGEIPGYQILNRLKSESPGINIDADGVITVTAQAEEDETAQDGTDAEPAPQSKKGEKAKS